jgi:hypothetical protein
MKLLLPSHVMYWIHGYMHTYIRQSDLPEGIALRQFVLFSRRITNFPTLLVRDFRLPPRREILALPELRSLGWLSAIDVSGQVSVSSSTVKRTAWPLKMVPIGCPETSMANSQ